MSQELPPDKSSRFNVLNEVHQRLHDMKNLQRASAWPHVEGVARAEKMVWDMISACQPKDSEPFTPSHARENVLVVDDGNIGIEATRKLLESDTHEQAPDVIGGTPHERELVRQHLTRPTTEDIGELADVLMGSLKEAGYVIGLATALHVANAVRYRSARSTTPHKRVPAPQVEGQRADDDPQCTPAVAGASLTGETPRMDAVSVAMFAHFKTRAMTVQDIEDFLAEGRKLERELAEANAGKVKLTEMLAEEMAASVASAIACRPEAVKTAESILRVHKDGGLVPTVRDVVQLAREVVRLEKALKT